MCDGDRIGTLEEAPRRAAAESLYAGDTFSLENGEGVVMITTFRDSCSLHAVARCGRESREG